MPEKFDDGPAPVEPSTCGPDSCMRGTCNADHGSYEYQPVEFIWMIEKSPMTFNTTLPHLKEFLREILRQGEFKFGRNLWRMTIILFSKVVRNISGKVEAEHLAETILELDDPIFNGRSFNNIATKIETIIGQMDDIDRDYRNQPWPYKAVTKATERLTAKMRPNATAVSFMVTSHTHFNVPYFEKMVNTFRSINNDEKNRLAGLSNNEVIAYLGMPNNFDGSRKDFFNDAYQSAAVIDKTYRMAHINLHLLIKLHGTSVSLFKQFLLVESNRPKV